MTTLETLQSLLADSYKLTPEAVAPDATLETLGIDSLGLLEVLFEIEDRFGIQVPTERPELHTVGDVAHYIDRLVAERRSSGQPGAAWPDASQPDAWPDDGKLASPGVGAPAPPDAGEPGRAQPDSRSPGSAA